MEFKQADKKYKSDHTVVYSCHAPAHVIFCPKYRRKVLTKASPAASPRLQPWG